MQWPLPLDLDNEYHRAMVSGALANLVLAPLLAACFQAAGVAWAAVGSQSIVLVRLFAALRRLQLSPFGQGSHAESDRYIHGGACIERRP
jgi:hypothetical protein